MITQELIDQLKAEVGKPIYKVEIGSKEYIFTYVSREEYKEIQDWIESNQQNISVTDIEQKLVDVALVYPMLTPMEWNLSPAGTIPSLARHIEQKSLLNPVDIDMDDISVENLNALEELQEIPKEEIEKVKSKSNFALRLVTLHNKQFVIRPLLRPEFAYIQKLPQGSDDELEGVKKCLILPKDVDFNEMPAGVVTKLAGQIMLLSGFNDTAKAVEL